MPKNGSRKDTKHRIIHLIEILAAQNSSVSGIINYGIPDAVINNLIGMLGDIIVDLENDTSSTQEAKKAEQEVYGVMFRYWKRKNSK